ncbi:unnamed protein product, partial [Laminaria digitata]
VGEIGALAPLPCGFPGGGGFVYAGEGPFQGARGEGRQGCGCCGGASREGKTSGGGFVPCGERSGAGVCHTNQGEGRTGRGGRASQETGGLQARAGTRG